MKNVLNGVIYSLVALVALIGIAIVSIIGATHYSLAIITGMITVSFVLLLCSESSKLQEKAIEA